MGAKTVLTLGVLGLAALTAVAVWQAAPNIESDVRASVQAALKKAGVEDHVKAEVSGQVVTLTVNDDAPDKASQLSLAEEAVRDARSTQHPELPVGDWITGPVAQIRAEPLTPLDSAPTAAPPPAIAGENATMLADAASATAPVAGIDALAEGLAPPTHINANCTATMRAALAGRQINYVQGGYVITADSQPVLDDVYRAVAGCSTDVRIVVSGYTDSTGDEEANRLISKARAQAAADALISRGLPGARIEARGYGSVRPVADNTTPEGRAANRRVVFEATGG